MFFFSWAAQILFQANTSAWNLIFQVSLKCQPSHSLCSSSVACSGEIRQGSTSWWLSPNIVKVYHFYMRLLISSWSFPPFSIIFVSCALAGLLLGKARMTQSEQSKQLWRGDVWRGRRNIFQNRFVCGMRLKSASKRTHPASLSYWKLISWPLSKASRSLGEQR